MSAPFMQLYVADYMADTRHLTCEQDGAYMRLLMAMWRAGGSLPADHAKLARIVGLSASRWVKVRDDVMAFFDEADGFITQARLSKEYQKAEEKSAKRSEAGKIGAQAKVLKNNETPQAIAEPLLKHSLEPDIRIEDVDVSASAAVDDLGWPVGMVAVVDALMAITPSDPRRAPWQTDRRSIDEYLKWQKAKVSWDTITCVITDLVAKKRDGPPTTMAYFTAAILQSHANRQIDPVIPEAQPHERRNRNQPEQSAGRSTAYIIEAVSDDQQRRDAEFDRASGF